MNFEILFFAAITLAQIDLRSSPQLRHWPTDLVNILTTYSKIRSFIRIRTMAGTFDVYIEYIRTYIVFGSDYAPLLSNEPIH